MGNRGRAYSLPVTHSFINKALRIPPKFPKPLKTQLLYPQTGRMGVDDAHWRQTYVFKDATESNPYWLQKRNGSFQVNNAISGVRIFRISFVTLEVENHSTC